MSEEEKKAISIAIYELEESYELHQCSWAKRCLDTIKGGVEKQQKEIEGKEEAYNNCYCDFKHYKQFESISKDVIRENREYFLCCLRDETFIDLDDYNKMKYGEIVLKELLEEK